jgi:hypothetical protein
MYKGKVRAGLWGLLVTAALAGLIVAGSRNLAHFDTALIGYTFATLFAAFGITYRYAMWLQRPPATLYWRCGWQMFSVDASWPATWSSCSPFPECSCT